MKIYATEYKGELSNNEWSIVTIWKTKELAIKAKNSYELNWPKDNIPEYRITEIDTDSSNDCIYDSEDLGK